MVTAGRLASAVTTAALCLLVASAARAQEILLTGPLAGAPATRSRATEPGAKASRSMVLRSGYVEAGADLVLLTCDECPSSASIQLSDASLFRPAARYSVAERLELTAGTELLIKQPELWTESTWQGGFVGLRVPFARHFAASIQARTGPLLGESGEHWQLESTWLAKANIDPLLRFELALGELSTVLLYDRENPGSVFLQELTGHVEAQIGHREAFWIGATYSIPVAHAVSSGGATLNDTRRIEPSPRLDLELGGVMTRGAWDLYALYAIIDRGDLADPGTTLPLLDGGFDQRQYVFGVRYRFEPGRDDPEAE